MAPTTLTGQKTTSSPLGRDVKMTGTPLQVAEMLAAIDGANYIARQSLHDPKNVRLAKKAIHQAFLNQVEGRGFSMVELLSTCPVNWGLEPLKALQWIKDHMVPVYPLGLIKSIPA